MRQADITELLHRRSITTTLLILAMLATMIVERRGDVVEIVGSRGLALPSANEWLEPGAASMWLNLAMNVAIVGVIALLNKTFNILRSITSLWGSVFILMQVASPMIMGQFYGGTLLALLMGLITALLYSCYGLSTAGNRRVFLIFALLSAASFIQYAFMFYIPVMVLGMVQMRIFNARSLVAAAIGVLTAPWLLIGSGLVSLDQVHWPEFVSTLSEIATSKMIHSLVVVGITMALGLAALCGNFMRLLSYNAKYRSYNGFLAILLITTIILLLVDYNNLSIYVPLLNLAASFQIALFFANRRQRSSWIAIAALMVVYVALYLSALFI